MIFFSLVEVLNKIIGLLVTGLLARALSEYEYGVYVSGIILFGYALEFSMYASQNRHNADLSQVENYLKSPVFRARRGLTMITSCLGCLGLLVLTSDIHGSFSIWPLLLILPLAPFTFDYIAYVQRRSRIIVMARFLSQLMALIWVMAIMGSWVSHYNVYWGNFFQSLLMMLVVTLPLLHMKLLPSSVLLAGITSQQARLGQLCNAARDQSKALSLRMLTLALVSGELILLGLLQSDLSGELAIAVRVIQVLYPFVVFYVDSKVSDISQIQFKKYYLKAIFGLSLLMVLLSPWLVRLLFGENFIEQVFTVALFMPAFVLQAVGQYFLLLSLKENCERYMLVLLAFINFVGLLLCGIIVYIDQDIRYIAAVISLKAVILLLFLPGQCILTRFLSLIKIAGLIFIIVILECWGYYQYAVGVLDSLMEFFK